MSDIIVQPVNLLKNIDLPQRKSPGTAGMVFLAIRQISIIGIFIIFVFWH